MTFSWSLKKNSRRYHYVATPCLSFPQSLKTPDCLMPPRIYLFWVVRMNVTPEYMTNCAWDLPSVCVVSPEGKRSFLKFYPLIEASACTPTWGHTLKLGSRALSACLSLWRGVPGVATGGGGKDMIAGFARTWHEPKRSSNDWRE